MLQNQRKMNGETNEFGEDILIPSYTPNIVCAHLTPEEVKDIVINLGAERYEAYEKFYIFPTICHNPIGTEASMKLYYYLESKTFYCYTECHEAFNLFGLIVRVLTLNGQEETAVSDAYNIIMAHYNSSMIVEEHYISVFERYQKNIGEQVQSAYNENILQSFYGYVPVEWLKEGISQDTMQKFFIAFSVEHNAITIPHFDVRGRLIGIRGRFLGYVKNGSLPKYMPLKIEGKIYTHQLSFNLYGLYQNLSAIQKARKAIIFESEKSVLKHYTMYGENSFAVACCGSNINKTQIDLLMKYGAIQEVVIALDREYEDPFSNEGKQYFDKIYTLGQKYTHYMDVSMIFDFENRIGLKDAPIDRGQETFELLYKERIKIRG